MLSFSVFHFDARIHFLSFSFCFALFYFYLCVLRPKNKKKKKTNLVLSSCAYINRKTEPEIVVRAYSFTLQKDRRSIRCRILFVFHCQASLSSVTIRKRRMVCMFSFWIYAIDGIARRKLRRKIQPKIEN